MLITYFQGTVGTCVDVCSVCGGRQVTAWQPVEVKGALTGSVHMGVSGSLACKQRAQNPEAPGRLKVKCRYLGLAGDWGGRL